MPDFGAILPNTVALLAIGSGTVVEHSQHQLEVVGSSPGKKLNSRQGQAPLLKVKLLLLPRVEVASSDKDTSLLHNWHCIPR